MPLLRAGGMQARALAPPEPADDVAAALPPAGFLLRLLCNERLKEELLAAHSAICDALQVGACWDAAAGMRGCGWCPSWPPVSSGSGPAQGAATALARRRGGLCDAAATATLLLLPPPLPQAGGLPKPPEAGRLQRGSYADPGRAGRRMVKQLGRGALDDGIAHLTRWGRLPARWPACPPACARGATAFEPCRQGARGGAKADSPGPPPSRSGTEQAAAHLAELAAVLEAAPEALAAELQQLQGSALGAAAVFSSYLEPGPVAAKAQPDELHATIFAYYDRDSSGAIEEGELRVRAQGASGGRVGGVGG